MKTVRMTILALFCFATLAALAFSASQAVSRRANVKEITFTKDIAPLFFKNCADCHRPGENAPFSALTYKDVRPWAKSIREKVANRTMPPWHADPHVGQWANDRRLAQAEIDAVVAWVDGGAKEGDAKDLPPAPQFADNWAIGKPDMVIPMPEEYTLAASGPDEIQYFEVDPGFKQDKYIQMAEARPGNRKIVHHIIAFIKAPDKNSKPQPNLTKEEMQKMREEMERESVFYQDGTLTKVKMDAPVYDDGCALPSGGSGFKRDGSGDGSAENSGIGMLLCGYAPGMNQARWDAGTVKKIPAGAKIVFQVHYNKAAGSVQKDRSLVGLVFANKPATKQLLTHPVANNYFKIPAGAENHRVTACWKVEEDIHIVTLMPHMHLRGKSQRIEAILPDGRKQVLLNVPNYDFNWQTVYYLKQPAAIPKGSTIMVTAYYDNSAKNKFNPNPNVPIRWGDPTYEDMMIGWIDYTVDRQNLKGSVASK